MLFGAAATYELRKARGKALDEVILHAGAVHKHAKIDAMQRLGFWRADDWQPEVGLALIDQVRSA